MNKLEQLLKTMGWHESTNKKYCNAGIEFDIDNESMSGKYWFYETDLYRIVIHDFFMKQKFIADPFPDTKPFVSLTSTYMKSANGVWLDPYLTMSSNMVFIMNIPNQNASFVLHENSPFFSVGINFKGEMLDEYIVSERILHKSEIPKMFFESSKTLTSQLYRLSNSIINCNLESLSAKIFMEAKAKEWLSLTLDTYFKMQTKKPLFEDDKRRIENVATYINDHYQMTIKQELLEKISLMSSTKLKKTFKEKYNMSITEYTQRKRMNVAEILLASTPLEIKDIALSVGYKSHSRFTELFKKYKGLYPKDIIKNRVI